MTSKSNKNTLENDTKQRKRKRVRCYKCQENCSGEVLNVQDRYFHLGCFLCKHCNCVLSAGSFYVRDDEYFCTQDYQQLFGTKCSICKKGVEGEVVTALDNTFHKECFKCDLCRSTFLPGTTVMFDGENYICHNCVDSSQLVNNKSYSRKYSHEDPNHCQPHDLDYFSNLKSEPTAANSASTKIKCEKCKLNINTATLIIAMEKTWHNSCFQCTVCKNHLSDKFIYKDNEIYCEQDYFAIHGIACKKCAENITGKVIILEDNYYHYDCISCSVCYQMFTQNQELYLASDLTRMWHKQCALRTNHGLDTHAVPLKPLNSDSDQINDNNKVKIPLQNINIDYGNHHFEDYYDPIIHHIRDTSISESEASSLPSRENSQYKCINSRVIERNPPIKSKTLSENTYSSLKHPSHGFGPIPENYKKAKSFFSDLENSNRSMTTSTPQNSKSSIRRSSEISSLYDYSSSNVSFSLQKSPLISATSTNTLKRTLHETHQHFGNNSSGNVNEPLGEISDQPSQTSDICSSIYDNNSIVSLDNNSIFETQSVPHVIGNANKQTQLTISVSSKDSNINSFRKSIYGSQPLRLQSSNSSNQSGELAKPISPSGLNFDASISNRSLSSDNPQNKYPYGKLQITAGFYHHLPRDVDRKRLEQHLNDSDFQSLFKMGREEFNSLPDWRKIVLRKEANLF